MVTNSVVCCLVCKMETFPSEKGFFFIIQFPNYRFWNKIMLTLNIYVYICMYMYVCIYTYIYIYMHVSIHTLYIYIYMYVCMYLCICICIKYGKTASQIKSDWWFWLAATHRIFQVGYIKLRFRDFFFLINFRKVCFGMLLCFEMY